MIGTVTLNPSIDHHVVIGKLVKDDAIRAQETRRDAGGKGINVSRAIKELGGETLAFSVAGGCAGYMLRSLMAGAGVALEAVELSQETRINVILTDRSDRTQTRVSASGPWVSLADCDLFASQILRHTPAPEWWVLGGSLPPGAPNDFYARLIAELRSRGAKCILDADGDALSLGVQARPYLIKPNEYELERLARKPLEDESAILEAARDIVSSGVEVVAVTLGGKGALVVDRHAALRARSPAVEVRSKVGAGDSFLAGCVLALSRGAPLEQAISLAMAAGTAAVMYDGTQLCRRSDVERLLSQIEVKRMPVAEPAATARPEPARARDVVCGMMVDPAVSSFAVDHGGVTYRFCSLKCQQQFLEDMRKSQA